MSLLNLLINVFDHLSSLRRGHVMRAKRLVAGALVSHRVYEIEDGADGEEEDEAADEDGEDDEEDDGP